MNKLFTLLALVGVAFAAPAFANEEMKAPAAAKTEAAKEMKAEDCTKLTGEAKISCEKAAEAAKSAPAAGHAAEKPKM